MENGYFYTLSAIAQSFAAIVSLYAIFVVYKLQILKEEKSDKFAELRKVMLKERRYSSGSKGPHEYDEEYVHSFSEKDLIHWAKRNSGRNDIIREKTKVCDKIESLNNLKTQILNIFKKILITNGITIGFSLIFLPMKDILPNGMPNFILLIAIIVAISSLYKTIEAIWITVTGVRDIEE